MAVYMCGETFGVEMERDAKRTSIKLTRCLCEFEVGFVTFEGIRYQ